MKKIIDVSEVEAIISNLKEHELFGTSANLQAILDKAPSVSDEVFGYFKCEPFGWTDCAETDEGAIALYEHPSTDKARIELLEATNKNLLDAINLTIEENGYLADGDNCTLRHLVMAIAEAEAQHDIQN